MTVWRTAVSEHALDDGILVGILNTTPDSFSDGGDYADSPAAVSAGLRMHEEGAAVVDVGGESTRPGAEPVSADEEKSRVVPVIEELAARGVPVSVDTSKPEVAAAAVAAGAAVINDVTGFRDPLMVEIASQTGVGVIVMHMQGEPRSMQDSPHYHDVVVEVKEFLLHHASKLIEAGVAADRIAIDPGFGFGKTARHNLEILSRLGELADTDYPLALGASRKSTLRELTGEPDPKRRDGATAVTTALAFERGARVFRVHDVAGSRDALRVAAAIVDPQRWERWQQD